jgi:fructokinase
MGERQSRTLVFGEVLFDRFADGSIVLGGAPFNVAWHLQAFGLSPLFISQVGDDRLGTQVRAEMKAWGMDASGLGIDSLHPTGTVEITIKDGEPEYDIIANRAYDYIDFDSLPPLPSGGTLYHGTLALRNNASWQALEQIRQSYSIPIFVDLNLRPPWWDRKCIQQVLQHAQWVKLNEHELAQIAPDQKTMENRIESLCGQYAVEQWIITRGEEGAMAVTPGGEWIVSPPHKTDKVVDTVGAGDAFSSILLLGQAKGWPLPLALERAHAFASTIVTTRGATINDVEFYQPFIDAWGLAE